MVEARKWPINILHIIIFVSVEPSWLSTFRFSAVLYDFSAVCRVPGRSSLPQVLSHAALRHPGRRRSLADVLGRLGSDSPQQPTLETPPAQFRFRLPAGVLFALGG